MHDTIGARAECRCRGALVLGLVALALLAACGGDDGNTPPQCTLGDSWATADDFQLSAGLSSSATHLAVADTGEIFVDGLGTVPVDTFHWVVRKSGDAGTSWTTVDDFARSGASTGKTGGNSIAVGPDGLVLSTGAAPYNGAEQHGVVRRSTDGGQTWAVVDEFLYRAGGVTQAMGVTIGDDGAAYVAFWARDATGVSHAFVRKSTDRGDTWTTVDDFTYGGRDATGLLVVAEGTRVWSLVHGLDTNGDGHAITRRSTDGGASWSTVDDFSYSGDAGPYDYTSPLDFVAGPDGELVATFYVGDPAQPGRAVIRQSTDGGATWSTVDDFQYAAGQDSTSSSVAFGPDGAMYVCGSGLDAGGVSHWTVRRSTDGATFTIVDDFQLVSGQAATCDAIRRDPAGNVYASGRATDASGASHWIVRKLSCD